MTKRCQPWLAVFDCGAIRNAGRVGVVRQELAEMHPALTADLFQPFQLGERVQVIVDAQVEVGPLFLAVDH